MCRGVRVHGGDDPVSRHLAGDAPAPLDLARFHVLAGHQPEQPNRLGLDGVQVAVLDLAKHGQRIGHQRAHQPVAGLGVVPGTGRLARVMIVVVGGQLQRRGGRDKPTHPPDGRHQLGDRVLGGDRVIQQGRVQPTPLAPSQHTRLGDHRPDRGNDPLGTVGGPQPAAPQGQHRRMEALVGQGQPTGDLPGDVLAQLLCRLAVRQPLQGLQHHDRGHLIGRDRGPATTRGKQVSEQLIRKQPLCSLLGRPSWVKIWAGCPLTPQACDR
jgi:hypothetical protein